MSCDFVTLLWVQNSFNNTQVETFWNKNFVFIFNLIHSLLYRFVFIVLFHASLATYIYSFTTRLFAQRKQHSTSSWNRMGQAKLSCCCLYAPCVLLSMKFRHFGACVPFLRETKSYKKKLSDFCIL